MDARQIIAHVSVGVTDLHLSAQFYDAVLATLDIYRQYEISGITIAYGKNCDFWIGLPENSAMHASAGNGAHIAFNAKSMQAVDEFYRSALENGGQGAGAPGPRPEYSDDYYAAFIRDRDGNKIEAVHNR